MFKRLIKQAIIFIGFLITTGTAYAGLSFVTTDTVTLTQPFNGISGLIPHPIGSTLNVGHLDFSGSGSEIVTYTYLGAESVTFVDKFYNNLGGTNTNFMPSVFSIAAGAVPGSAAKTDANSDTETIKLSVAANRCRINRLRLYKISVSSAVIQCLIG